MNQPLVSVVIPVYNVESYILDCIDSVLAQSYRNLEIIVVDDESPDNSISLLSGIQDSRIRIVRQKNRGLAGARNTGIREATGEFVALLDSDDLWHPEKVSEHVRVMQNDPEIGVSFSASMFVNEAGESLNRLQTAVVRDNYTAGQIFCRNPIGNGSAPVISKDVLTAIRFRSVEKDYDQFFDERLRQSEDIECWTRIALTTGTKFRYVNRPLTYYRLNSGGLSANVDKQFASWEFVLNKIQGYAPDFASEYGSRARAYQYRYLARRLVVEGETQQALVLMSKAARSHLEILWKEPMRTWSTLAAGLGLSLVPYKARMKLIQRLV